MNYQELAEIARYWIDGSQSTKWILVACLVGLMVVWQYFRFRLSVRTKQRVQAATDAYAARESSQHDFSTSLYERIAFGSGETRLD